ncbi:MAG TPA: Vms1/Ankzf1 family peptidyl-tRNA hydrolase [Actinomycetota bacterium]|nr:Vms1/Ankzf1 family peptidyl-tRNA hydrolase [Actinomycetota bacterium]
MAARRIDERLLRRVRDEAPDGGPIVSMYLSLDPGEFAAPEARGTQLNSLLHEARRPDKHLREILDRIRAQFDPAWPADGAHGIVVFAGPDWLRLIQLPRSPKPAMFVSEVPVLEPLAEMIEPERWAVWLVNRRAARIMVGTPELLTEVDEVEDLVHGKHDQGGWSQARYQRSVEQDVDIHLKHAAARLDAFFKQGAFECLVVAPEEEIKGRVLDSIPPEIAPLLVDVIDVDIEYSKPNDIAERLRALVEQRETFHEKDALERLAELLAKKSRATEGAAGVLAALNENAVDVLVYDPSAHPSGTHCPTCGVLDHQARECPIDGTTMDVHENILDLMIERTIATSGEPLPIKHHKLDVKDGVAALTRF